MKNVILTENFEWTLEKPTVNAPNAFGIGNSTETIKHDEKDIIPIFNRLRGTLAKISKLYKLKSFAELLKEVLTNPIYLTELGLTSQQVASYVATLTTMIESGSTNSVQITDDEYNLFNLIVTTHPEIFKGIYQQKWTEMVNRLNPA